MNAYYELQTMLTEIVDHPEREFPIVAPEIATRMLDQLDRLIDDGETPRGSLGDAFREVLNLTMIQRR